MKISGYKILATILFLLIIYGLYWSINAIWMIEDKVARILYVFYLILLIPIHILNEEYPNFFEPIKNLFKYINNFLSKEYKL